MDILLSAFTHIPLIDAYDGILFIHPGSSTWPDQRGMPGTVAVLDLSPDSRDARIVDLSKLD